MISEQAKQRMRDLAARYPVARSAVMPALYIAQQEEGYITQEGLQAVAEAIGMTVDDVESVATFYTMYYQQPPGKKVIKVCTSISCYLRNCDALVEHLEKRLGIKRGETTADGNYHPDDGGMSRLVWHRAGAAGQRRVRRKRHARNVRRADR